MVLGYSYFGFLLLVACFPSGMMVLGLQAEAAFLSIWDDGVVKGWCHLFGSVYRACMERVIAQLFFPFGMMVL